MPDLYLIRHGIAADRETYTEDGDRPLTQEGIAKTRKVAQRLHQLGIRVDSLLTSPLVRARQTAEILVEAAVAPRLEESLHLLPGGDCQAWVENWLQGRSSDLKTLALVGHEPDLGEWAEQLIWGEIRHHLQVKKAGVLGLTLPSPGNPIGQSTLFWLTPPRFLL